MTDAVWTGAEICCECGRRECCQTLQGPPDDTRIDVLSRQALPFALQTATERANALGITVRVYLCGELKRIATPRLKWSSVGDRRVRESHRRIGLYDQRET